MQTGNRNHGPPRRRINKCVAQKLAVTFDPQLLLHCGKAGAFVLFADAFTGLVVDKRTSW